MKKKIKCSNCESTHRVDDEGICNKCSENVRICRGCGDVMSSGYIYESDVYCCESCLPISKEQWEKEYTDNNENCYTEWESIYMD